MALLTSKNPFETPYIYCPYMSETGTAYTRERYKLHPTLGAAKNALLGKADWRAIAQSDLILYEWDAEHEGWHSIYIFDKGERVAFNG